jgi:hypothetical protein
LLFAGSKEYVENVRVFAKFNGKENDIEANQNSIY